MRQLVKFAALSIMFAGMSVGAQATEWRGYAISGAPRAATFTTPGVYATESAAQMAAKTLCENYSGRACDFGDNVIAIPDFWSASAVLCEGDGFIGGSRVGAETQRALEKAARAGYSPNRCDVVL